MIILYHSVGLDRHSQQTSRSADNSNVNGMNAHCKICSEARFESSITPTYIPCGGVDASGTVGGNWIEGGRWLWMLIARSIRRTLGGCAPAACSGNWRHWVRRRPVQRRMVYVPTSSGQTSLRSARRSELPATNCRTPSTTTLTRSKLPVSLIVHIQLHSNDNNNNYYYNNLIFNNFVVFIIIIIIIIINVYTLLHTFAVTMSGSPV